MKKSVFTYGAIAGVIVSVMMLISFSFYTADSDFKYGELIGYSTMIIAFSTIFFAIRSHRDNQLDGSISFLEAFKIGIGITLIASAIYVLAWMIVSNTIAKDFMAEYFQHSVEKLNASGLSQEEISNQISKMEKMRDLYKNPFMKMGITFMEIFPVGLIISLISSLILKKK